MTWEGGQRERETERNIPFICLQRELIYRKKGRVRECVSDRARKRGRERRLKEWWHRVQV